MKQSSHKDRMRDFVRRDPDTALEIVRLCQPFLASRVEAESDHEKAKTILMLAEDPWDKLKHMRNEFLGSDDKSGETKIRELMKKYDKNALLGETRRETRNTLYSCFGAIVFLIVLGAIFYFLLDKFIFPPIEKWLTETQQNLSEYGEQLRSSQNTRASESQPEPIDIPRDCRRRAFREYLFGGALSSTDEFVCSEKAWREYKASRDYTYDLQFWKHGGKPSFPSFP